MDVNFKSKEDLENLHKQLTKVRGVKDVLDIDAKSKGEEHFLWIRRVDKDHLPSVEMNGSRRGFELQASFSSGRASSPSEIDELIKRLQAVKEVFEILNKNKHVFESKDLSEKLGSSGFRQFINMD